MFRSTTSASRSWRSARAPYVETDTPAPINADGISKLAGGYFIRYLLDRYFIVRVTGLYGVAGSFRQGRQLSS